MITDVGKHRVRLGSIASLDPDSLLPGGRVSMMFSDPPWGNSYLKMFATYTEKATGVRPPQIEFGDMVVRYADIIESSVEDYAFIEMGADGAGAFEEELTPRVESVTVREMTYGKGRPARMIVVSKSGRSPAMPVELRGGLAMVVGILQGVSGECDSVLDPCCGAGYTARAAMRFGMTFYGNELNPARLKKTVAYLGSGK